MVPGEHVVQGRKAVGGNGLIADMEIMTRPSAPGKLREDNAAPGPPDGRLQIFFVSGKVVQQGEKPEGECIVVVVSRKRAGHRPVSGPSNGIEVFRLARKAKSLGEREPGPARVIEVISLVHHAAGYGIVPPSKGAGLFLLRKQIVQAAQSELAILLVAECLITVQIAQGDIRRRAVSGFFRIRAPAPTRRRDCGTLHTPHAPSGKHLPVFPDLSSRTRSSRR